MAADDFEKELGGGTKKSKNFWLVWIVIDVIALVFFGFMVYKSLSAKFASPALPKENIVIKSNPAQTPLPAPPPQAAPQVIAPTADGQSHPAAPAPETVPAAPPPAQPAATQPAPPPPPRMQSVFIEPTNGKGRSVTFKYYGPAKKKVSIVSGFTMTKPQALKKTDGVWQGSFVIYPGEYKYLFIVDGVKTLDPNAEEQDGRSVVTIP